MRDSIESMDYYESLGCPDRDTTATIKEWGVWQYLACGICILCIVPIFMMFVVYLLANFTK